MKWDKYSHYHIDNAFTDFNYGLNVYGLNGCSPAEILHFIIKGILERWQEDAFDRIKNKGKMSTLIEQIFASIRPYLRVNNNTTHKLSSRFRFTKGLLRKYHLSADEKLNQMLLLLVVFQTNRFIWENEESEDFLAFLYFAERLLMFYGWVIQDTFQTEEIDIAERVCIPSLMEDVKIHIRRIKSKTKSKEEVVGWKLFKFHVLLHICRYLRMFGAMINYDGGPSESHLKHFGSQPAQNTQKRHDATFEKQVCQRFTEKLVINTCNDIVDQDYINTNKGPTFDQSEINHKLVDNADLNFQGKQYTVYFRAREVFIKTSTKKRTLDRTYDIEVKHGTLNKNSEFTSVIKSLQRFCYDNTLVTGWFHIYTEAYIKGTLYRANYEYHEGERSWLSWCNIEWQSSSGKSTHVCPGNILLICDIRNIKQHLKTNEDFNKHDSVCMLVVKSTSENYPIQDQRIKDDRLIPVRHQNELSIFKVWDIDNSKVHFLSNCSIASPAYIVPNVRSTKKHKNYPNRLGNMTSTSVIEVTDPLLWGKLFIETYKNK